MRRTLSDRPAVFQRSGNLFATHLGLCHCRHGSPSASAGAPPTHLPLPLAPSPPLPKGQRNPSATALRCIIPGRAIAAGLETIKHSTRFSDPLGSGHPRALGWRREAWPLVSHIPVATQTVCPDTDELKEKTRVPICSNTVMENCCGPHQGVPVSNGRAPGS